MIPVYDAAHSTDAHLVKNLLAQAGITSHIRGEYLQGGLGDLPVSGMVQVCVDAADLESARAIIDDWNSGTLLMEEDSPQDIAESVITPAVESSFGRTLAVGLFGIALGVGVTWAALRGPDTHDVFDYNNDGIADERFIYSGNVLQRVEYDRNHDGKIDATLWYSASGIPTRGESDNNFDGRQETESRYLHGQWLSDASDRDGDGVVDYEADAISGVLFSERWFDANSRIIKRLRYKDGNPVSGEVDTDKDGILDTRHHYDRTGEILRSERI